MSRRVLLLDLDDTILRFGPTGFELWDELIPRYARHYGLPEAALREALDVERRWYWSDPERSARGRLDMVGARRTILTRSFERIRDAHRLGPDAERIAERLADEYTWTLEERVAPLPGAIETLEHWQGEGVRMGLVTNGSGPFQRRKVERFGLERFFDGMWIEGELGFGKPDPRVFEQALAALEAQPETTWMIGDNLGADVLGAQSVGVRTVWIDRDRTGLPAEAPARPDRTALELAELAALHEDP